MLESDLGGRTLTKMVWNGGRGQKSPRILGAKITIWLEKRKPTK